VNTINNMKIGSKTRFFVYTIVFDICYLDTFVSLLHYRKFNDTMKQQTIK
jgi:hypothetical protein